VKMRRMTLSRNLALGELLANPKNVVLKGARTEATPCPYCGAPNNTASSGEGEPPNVGDLSICVYCAGLAQFDAELRAVKFDVTSIKDPDEYRMVRAAIDQVRNTGRIEVFRVEGKA